jgi:hypothetical protein
MAHHECEWKRGKGSTQRLESRIGSKPTATAVLTNGLLMEEPKKSQESAPPA